MQITLRMAAADGGAVALPHAYQYLILGMLYDAWQADPAFSARLHREADGERLFRGYTFGPIEGKYESRDRQVVYAGETRLTLRAYDPEIVLRLADGLREKKTVRLGENVLRVTDIALSDEHIEREMARVRMLSPITVYRTGEDKKAVFFDPSQDAFYAAVSANAARKYAALTGKRAVRPLVICPARAELPKRLFTVFKGSYITAWYGEYVLQGEAEMLDTLYQAGLGSKNGQGFGMFRVT